MKRNNRKVIRMIAFLTMAVLPLLGCGSDSSSESTMRSTELYASNVTAVFSLDGPHNVPTPDLDLVFDLGGNPIFFAGYETYAEVDEAVLSLVTAEEYEKMDCVLADLASYMDSSDDYAFVVWTYYAVLPNGFWYDFYGNVLTRHTVWCGYPDAEAGKLEVVMLSRDMVEDIGLVTFANMDHNSCITPS